MRAAWIKTLVAAALATAGAAQQHGVPFPSPDGTRVVRLSLTTCKGWAGAPSLQIEYSMVRAANEVIIRPFATSSGGSENARYRVVWDQDSRRFAVLGTEVTGRGTEKMLRLASGEYVLLTHDRSTVAPARKKDLENDAWGVAKWKSAGAVELPLRELDITKPAEEYSGRTGKVKNGIASDRVQNVTTHSNTQNFAPGRLAVTPTIEVLVRQRAPEGNFEARLARAQSPTVLLAEGDTYLDQQWVLLYPLAEERLEPKNGIAPRLVWSQDGRHVLVVTGLHGQPACPRLPGSDREEVFLLFDTQLWQGAVAPSANVLGLLQLAK